jgi:hypothetical protein
MAKGVRAGGLNENVAVHAAEYFNGTLRGLVDHLLRIRTFGKGSTEKMEFRKPPQISAVLLALSTLPSVLEKDKEKENDYHQTRKQRGLRGVVREGTHRSHSPTQDTPKTFSPGPLRVRQHKPTAGADSMGAEEYIHDVLGRPYPTTGHTLEICV